MSKPQQPKHCDLGYFPIEENQLLVGGQSIEQLARQTGGSPFYAYDRKVIDQRIQVLRDTLPSQIRLHYAVKANPMPALVQHVAQQVDGLDIASQGELAVALMTTTEPQHISFTGPGKDEAELQAAIAAGVTLNIESETEMRRAADLAVLSGQGHIFPPSGSSNLWRRTGVI